MDSLGAAQTERPEISDLVVDYDPDTLERLDVRRDVVLGKLEELRMHEGVRIVATWPSHGGVLDRAFVDGVLVRSHLELQRLSEEFQQGPRMQRLLRPMLDAIRSAGAAQKKIRIVDIGCGSGYVIRWLAARGELGADVELAGCDYNAALVDLAESLQKAESLPCTFERANAFRLREPANIFLSTGVIHHFRGDGLRRFFEEQHTGGAYGFLHCDIKPSLLAPLGAWMFHRARMREPLARHDGVLSAIRAHAADLLLKTARDACPDWQIGVFDGQFERFPLLRVMQCLIGVRRDLAAPYFANLGAALGARIVGLAP